MTNKKPTAKKPEPPQTTIARRRINRGSTRRVTNAVKQFDAAMVAFTAEIDLQFFESDDKGARTGEWDMVKSLRAMRTGVIAEINAQLYPAATDDATGDE